MNHLCIIFWLRFKDALKSIYQNIMHDVKLATYLDIFKRKRKIFCKVICRKQRGMDGVTNPQSSNLMNKYEKFKKKNQSKCNVISIILDCYFSMHYQAIYLISSDHVVQ